MKKLFSIVIVFLMLMAGTAWAVDPPGVINIFAGGNNGNVTINTTAPYVQDQLKLVAPGAFSVSQSNRFVPIGPWTGDGNDIDRTAAFTGSGTITTTTNYLSTDAWSIALAKLNTSVVATADGGLHQNLTFSQNSGGAFSQDQWKKQRDMLFTAAGNYTIDVSNVGASFAPSLGSMPIEPPGGYPAYSFSINAIALSGSANLYFPSVAVAGYQALSNNGDHGTYTGMSTNFVLGYTGAPVVNVNFGTVIGGTIVVTETPGVVAGTGAIQ